MGRGRGLQRRGIRHQQWNPSISVASWLHSWCTRANGGFGGEGAQANFRITRNGEERGHSRKMCSGLKAEKKEVHQGLPLDIRGSRKRKDGA